MALRTPVRVAAAVVTVVTAGLGVLAVEAVVASRRSYLPASSAPSVDGLFPPPGGSGGTARTLRLAVLGDSTAAGVGVRRTEQTVGGELAAMLARETGQPVLLTGYGVSGARVADLPGQVADVLRGQRPDVAVLLVGANDATHLTRLSAVRAGMDRVARQLTDAGVATVVGTTPDLGAVTSVPQPLRSLLGLRGRYVAAAQRDGLRRTGTESVDLAARTGKAFRADPSRYLSSDEFHPSAAGYRLWAEALLPAVLSAAN